MLNGACGIIKIIVRYNDFLRKVIYILKSIKFSLICLVFCYAISNLYVELLCALRCKEIYFFAVVVIYIHLISHINQLVIDDIFKVVSKIETVVHTANGIEANVCIVYF